MKVMSPSCQVAVRSTNTGRALSTVPAPEQVVSDYKLLVLLLLKFLSLSEGQKLPRTKLYTVMWVKLGGRVTEMKSDDFFVWGPLFCGWGFPGGSEDKASTYNVGDLGSIPGSGRSPGEGNGNPIQYSCLENPMDGEAW